MTDHEKAIVMAYTGACMLAGDKFQIFHKYIESICGRPVYTHELPLLRTEIMEKSKADFLEICRKEEPNMMREEFEAITGAKVGYYFYAMVIEPMYNASPECFNKFDYCTLFTKMSIAKTQKLFYDKHPEMKEEEKLK